MSPADYVRQLVAQGYKQVSSRYRIVARLPDGMTGIEALESVDASLAKHMRDTMNKQAAEQYLRVYAPLEQKVELTEEEWIAWRDLQRSGR